MRDPSWLPQNGRPTQQLSSNEGEVMSVGLRRIVMLNVRSGCYSVPLLSFFIDKTRGGDKPKKNLMVFPFKYTCYFTTDVSVCSNVSGSPAPRNDKTGMTLLWALLLCRAQCGGAE